MDCDSCCAWKSHGDMRSCRIRMGTLWQEPVCPWQPEHPCFLFCTLWLLHGINHGYCTGGHWTHEHMNIFELHQTLGERGYWGNYQVLSLFLREQQGRDVVLFSLSHRRKEAFSSPTKDNWERGRKVSVLLLPPNPWDSFLFDWKWKWSLLIYFLQLDYRREICWEA